MSENCYSVRSFENVDRNQFFEFCRQAFLDTTQPAHTNMWAEHWQSETHTLPYLLEIEKRFLDPNGKFFVIYYNDYIVGCSGIYQSDFNQHICLAGIRSWINSDHRGRFLLGKYLFPEQVRWAKHHKYKQIAVTFNEYNVSLKNIFLRNGVGVQKNRQADSLFYTGVHQVDFPVTIKHTKQWILYQKLDPVWLFDYSTIKHQD
jgi:hypothetical protein